MSPFTLQSQKMPVLVKPGRRGHIVLPGARTHLYRVKAFLLLPTTKGFTQESPPLGFILMRACGGAGVVTVTSQPRTLRPVGLTCPQQCRTEEKSQADPQASPISHGHISSLFCHHY